MIPRTVCATLLIALVMSFSPSPVVAQGSQDEAVAMAIERISEADAGMASFFESAAGYVVFPNVGKGGFGIGGAHGNGQVYEDGVMIGSAELIQVTIGLQVGGQSYIEVIFFKAQEDLDRFTGGNYEFGAQVSAVAVTAGASADAAYNHGVMVFTMANGGLMYEATLAGQKFSYEALGE
jgi:lipid-binding SYLF domain-containing protein